MTTSRAGVGRHRAGLRWVVWAAGVAALAFLAQRISRVADPAWTEEVALVLVIGVATVAAPPVLARVDRLPAEPSRPVERAPEAALSIGPSGGPSSLTG